MLAAPAPLGALLVAEGVVDAVLPVHGLAPLEPGAVAAAAAEEPSALGGEPVDLAVNLHGRGPQSTAALAALDPRRLLAFAPAGGGGERGGAPAWDDAEHEVLRWCRLVDALAPLDGSSGARGAGTWCSPADLVLRDRQHRGGPVLVHPGAASGSRRWPAERWAAVVAALRAAGHRVAVTGSAAEADLCAAVAVDGADDLAGRLSLAELLEAVAASPLLLSGDTGVAHAATAVRTPSVLLFGPTSPARWGPALDADRHRVLWPAPAGHAGDPHADATDPVLLLTSVEDVLDAAAGRLPAP